MQIPHVAIFITPQGELAMSHVMSDASDPLQVETPLDFFDGKGYEETIKYIGRVVLGLMSVMYPETMAKHPELEVPVESKRDMDTIRNLVSKSVTTRTSAYIATIDRLVDEVSMSDPMVRMDSTIVAWPDIRRMLEKHSS